MSKTLAILMTCHNRVETTLGCLRGLFEDMGRQDAWACKVFLVDDGSTDATGVRVSSDYPNVHVIVGDGNLYWARGMALAWKTAAAEEIWDAYLWLNDDARLRIGALAKLAAADDGESIVVGDLQDASGKIVYGMREGGLFTGNCVLVPKAVYERMGMICGEYAHAWADSDYAQRARHMGVRIVSGGIVGMAEWHPNRPGLARLSFRKRISLLRDPKGWNLHDLWLYRRRNWGTCRAVVSCLHLLMHVLKGER